MLYRQTRWLLFATCFFSPSFAHAQSQNTPAQIDAGIATRTAQEPQTAEPPRPSAAIPTPPDAASAGLPERLVATSIRVDGGNDLPADEIAAAISPFVGHRLSANDAQDLLTAVSGVARAHGYLFAHSSIPVQTSTAGDLHVLLDEGHVDEVRQTGKASAAVADILRPLAGHAPKRAEVERQLMLAGDLPGIRIGDVHYSNDGGKGVLIVPVAYDRVDASVTVDNRGLEALGPERVRLTTHVNGILSDRDSVTFQGLSTPFQPQELTALYGRYAFVPTNSGTELAIYGTYGQTRPGGIWSDYDPHGKSESVGISIAQPLARGMRNSLWLMAQADRIGVREWWDGALSRRDVVTTVGASINGYTPLAGGRLRGGAGISQGVLALGATRRDYPLASRYDAGSNFTLFNAWANWQAHIAGPFSARLATVGQLTTDPLPAVEQLTIGGPSFGRGYNFSERTGDEGVLGSAELQARVLDSNAGFVRQASLYAFADAGYVANLETDFGTGDLYSAGAGARFNLGQRLSFELEAAFPINAVRYDSGDKSPRLSFNLTNNF